MPCAAFEDLLDGYDELDAAERQRVSTHMAVCGDCREYLETLADLDRELAGLYQGLQPRPGFMADGFAAEVISRASAARKPLRQPRPPSAWPEILDFCGWAAIAAIVALLGVTATAQAGITLQFPAYAGWYAAAAFALAALLTLTWRAKSGISFRAR